MSSLFPISDLPLADNCKPTTLARARAGQGRIAQYSRALWKHLTCIKDANGVHLHQRKRGLFEAQEMTAIFMMIAPKSNRHPKSR